MCKLFWIKSTGSSLKDSSSFYDIITIGTAISKSSYCKNYFSFLVTIISFDTQYVIILIAWLRDSDPTKKDFFAYQKISYICEITKVSAKSIETLYLIAPSHFSSYHGESAYYVKTWDAAFPAAALSYHVRLLSLSSISNSSSVVFEISLGTGSSIIYFKISNHNLSPS
jgi:hypothetical protein